MNIVAHGRYDYWQDGIQQAITEPWELRQGKLGLRLQGQRCIDGAPVLDVVADYRGARCQSLELRWQPENQQLNRDFSYEIDGSSLLWRDNNNGAAQSLSLPTNCVLYPLLRAATGPLVSLLSTTASDVVLPNLRNPADPESFLRPLLSQRHVEVIETLNNGDTHLRYYGGEYGDAGSDYWLNQYGLVTRYLWKSSHGVWEVRLADFTVEPVFSGFNCGG